MTFQLFVVLVGVIVGWIRKGSIWSITQAKLRILWALPICYMLQLYSIYHLHGSAYEWSVVASYIGILIFTIVNLRIPGIVWALCGTLANFVVMAANGLRMPAYIPAVRHFNPSVVPLLIRGEYGKSIAMGSSTHLNFLGDIFTFDIGYVTLISIGDVLFAIGLVIFIQHAMIFQNRSTRHYAA